MQRPAVCVCVCQQAQELFLLSTRPITALEMHKDLLHWDQAMKLAATLAPEQVCACAPVMLFVVSIGLFRAVYVSSVRAWL